MHRSRTSFALAAMLTLPAAAFAQGLIESGSFDLHVSGKEVGKDTYKIDRQKSGYKIQSRFSYAAGPGAEGQYAIEYRFDDKWVYEEGSANNLASPAHFSVVPNKARTELTLGGTQAGSTGSSFVSIKPNLIILPPFDPAAAQAALLYAVNNPTEKNTYSVFIPFASAGGGGRGGRGGRGGGADSNPDPAAAAQLPPGNNAYDAVWIKGLDLAGFIDGKRVPVHTYALAFGPFKWIFFADESNNLMQVNVSMLKAAYIRMGFRLDPASVPAARPNTPAAPGTPGGTPPTPPPAE